MALTACYEDGDYAALSLWGVVADHENRLTALEEWQEQANSDIAALQQLVNATTADYITGVTPVMQGGEQVGYTITFLHAAPITIYHGKQGAQGEDGDTPRIGVTQGDDGNWYWTLNGELMTDEEHNPIRANGLDGEEGEEGQPGTPGSSAPAPELATGQSLAGQGVAADADGAALVPDGIYLSVDKGKTWYRVSGTDGAQGDDGEAFFQSVDTSGEDFVVFTLTDGTSIRVPRYKEAMLTLAQDGTELTDLTQDIVLAKGEVTYIAPEGMQVSVRVLEGENWSATVEGNAIKLTAGQGKALLEVVLTDNGRVVEVYRLTVVFFAGEGTQGQPYVIGSANELVALSGKTNEGKTFAGVYFELTEDIDLSGIDFEPFLAFAGTLDGNGHFIRNLLIENDGAYTHTGLFKQVDGVVRNLNVEGTVYKKSKVPGQENRVHALGGVVAINNGLVENCTFSGSVISDVDDPFDYIGGVVGCVQNNGIVKGCAYLYSDGGKMEIVKAQATGGVVGWCSEDSYVIGCYNTGNIDYQATAGTLGGVVGTVYSAHAVACYNEGIITVSAGNSSCAGVIGNNSMNTSTVTACYHATDAQTSSNVFLIGYTGNGVAGTAKFNTCYWLDVDGYTAFSGNVTADDCTDCAAKTADELKSQATVNALNAAIGTWNTVHNDLCNYRFAVDGAGGYPVLVEE